MTLSDKMSKDKEDLRLGAYILTQKDVKEFIKKLKVKIKYKRFKEKYMVCEIIDKLAGKELI